MMIPELRFPRQAKPDDDLHVVCSFCRQTHECEQGYAAGDHIEKHCYSLSLTRAEVEELWEASGKVDKEFERIYREIWDRERPEEDDYSPFVGLGWIELTPPIVSPRCVSDDNFGDVIRGIRAFEVRKEKRCQSQ